jgi:hypothetical protein
MRFFFLAKLTVDACSQKVSKNLKIVFAQVTQTKTGLSAVRTFNPLGVKHVGSWQIWWHLKWVYIIKF